MLHVDANKWDIDDSDLALSRMVIVRTRVWFDPWCQYDATCCFCWSGQTNSPNTVIYLAGYGWITHQARHAAEIDAVYILMRIILLIGNKTHKSYQYQKLGYLVGGADG